MTAANPVLIEVTRGGLVESRHRGAVHVVDADGAVVLSLGAVERRVFPRSAIKILQALPLVESGAADAFACSDAELALACASHSGEAIHTERIAVWLARLGLDETALACAPHDPFHGETARAMIRAGTVPCRLHNNCSGKHTGFLTLARHLNAPVKGYEGRRHAVQVAAFEAIAALTGQDDPDLPYGIDGCTAPNPALPLKDIAAAMARLAGPGRLPPVRARASARLTAAMAAHPELVAGTGRACTAFMRACLPGSIVKTGAEGVYTGILPALGLGFALKIDDGATRAGECLAALLLDRLGAIRPEARPDLDAYLAPAVRTWGGIVAGAVRKADPAPF